MSDSQRVYTQVHTALKKYLTFVPQNHRIVLAMMITGIVKGRNAQLAQMSNEIPSRAKNTSTERRLRRFVQNQRVDVQQYFMPFARILLEYLAKAGPLELVVDSSVVGRQCVALMVGVAFKNRVLPITWLVYKGKKGHTTVARHIQVLRQAIPLLPENARVVLLGDGEFDNVEMLDFIQTNTSWNVVVKTAKSTVLDANTEYRSQMKDIQVRKGTKHGVLDLKVTQKAYGPMHAVVWWEEPHKEPLFLLTDMADIWQACRHYRRRALIETLFSDTKSRGFGIAKSRLSVPERVDRLLLAVCLSYLWMVYLGTELCALGCQDVLDRKDRRDKSLFRLGLDWLKYQLKQGLGFHVRFHISPCLLHF
mgnify:CR=1 FL=1